MTIVNLNVLLMDISKADIIRQQYLTNFFDYRPNVNDRIITLNKELDILNEYDERKIIYGTKPQVLFGIGNGGTLMPIDQYNIKLNKIIPIYSKAVSNDIRYVTNKDSTYGLKKNTLVETKTYEVAYVKKAETNIFSSKTGFPYSPDVLQCKLTITADEQQALLEYLLLKNETNKKIDEIVIYVGKPYPHRQPLMQSLEIGEYVDVVAIHKVVLDNPINLEASILSTQEYVVNFYINTINLAP